VCLYGSGPRYRLIGTHLSPRTSLAMEVSAAKQLRFSVRHDGSVDGYVQVDPGEYWFRGTANDGRIFSTVLTVAKSWPSPIEDRHGIARGKTRVSGVVFPGLLAEHGETVRFTNGTTVVDVAVTGDRFQVDLVPGMWTVRSIDGRVCQAGIYVNPAGSWQVLQIIGRIEGCTPASQTTP
jgi:hypothetical protein